MISPNFQLWGEVKAVAPEGYLHAYDTAREYARARYAARKIDYAVDIYAAVGADQRDYKLLLNLLDRHQEAPTAFAALAPNYLANHIAKYSVKTNQGEQQILAALSDDSRLLVPWQLGMPKVNQEIEIQTATSKWRVELTRWSDELLIGARRRPSPDGGLASISSASGMHASTACERIRRDIKKAGQQIHRACKIHYDAPGLVFLVPRSHPISKTTFVSALLGDLMVSFATSTKGLEKAASYLGRNGVYRPDQQRYVSGCYLVQREHIIYAPNPFALFPVANILPEAEVIPTNPGAEIALGE
jgi:hypothetical protein